MSLTLPVEPVADSTDRRCRIRQAAIDWQFQREHFDPDFWHDQPGFQQTIGGRGGSCRIEVDGRAAVLRRYRRGGAVQGFFHDQYLWLGLSRSRTASCYDQPLTAPARRGFWPRSNFPTPAR